MRGMDTATLPLPPTPVFEAGRGKRSVRRRQKNRVREVEEPVGNAATKPREKLFQETQCQLCQMPPESSSKILQKRSSGLCKRLIYLVVSEENRDRNQVACFGTS